MNFLCIEKGADFDLPFFFEYIVFRFAEGKSIRAQNLRGF